MVPSLPVVSVYRRFQLWLRRVRLSLHEFTSDRLPAAADALPPVPSDFDADGALTRDFLLRRGFCCENGCRHCPYGFIAGRDNVMSPQDVAKVGYEGLMDEELFVIAGAANKAMIAARRILPVSAQAKLNKKMNTEVPPEKATHERGEKEFAEPKE